MSQEGGQLFVGDVGPDQLYLLQTGENLSEDLVRYTGDIHMLIHLQISQTQTCPQVIKQRGRLNMNN